MNIKRTLLKLSDRELKEREKSRKDYFFYLGECEDKDSAISDPALLGQSWITLDDLDYIPSQVIDNKVKPLIAKQARFMFGRRPDILIKAYDKNDKEKTEELRQFIDIILTNNKFWSNTLKAFRLATVTKRVLLRMEANPGQPIKIYYHDINDFNYEVDPNDLSNLRQVTLVKQDSKTAKEEIINQIWYRYTYYIAKKENSAEVSCFLKTETFKGNNLEIPIATETKDTGLSKIPCWLIVNEQSITNTYGVTDIKDLRSLQDRYNRRLSDFDDALRFLMFGQTVFIDAQEDGVNNAKVAPNSVVALVSIDDGERKATAQRLESNFTNAEPVKMYLDLLDKSMHEKLSIPTDDKLKDVPSAKTIKYIYNELIARCDEKWNDWEPAIINFVQLMVEACGTFNCYSEWKEEWNKLKYNLVIKRNYPIPEDDEDKKRLALEEVAAKVRSNRSYIKDFSDDEDYEAQFTEVIEDIKSINEAEQDQFQKAITGELNE